MSDQKNSEKTARRELLSFGALTAASTLLGMLAAACGDDAGAAQADGSTPGAPDAGSASPDAGKPDAAADAQAQSDGATALDAQVGPLDPDVAQLNVLLSLEHAAIAVYAQAAPLIDATDSSDYFYPLRATLRDVALQFLAHHQQYAAALRSAIDALRGTPVEGPVVPVVISDFLAKKDILNIFKLACAGERNGLVSYNGVIPQLEAAKHRYLAGVIEGGASQHFALLFTLIRTTLGAGPQLSAATASKLVPQAFVRTVGAQPGLETAPVSYFS